MNNNDKIISFKEKRASGRPKLTEEEKRLREEQKEIEKLEKNKIKAQVKKELEDIKKAIPALINIGLPNETILNMLTDGKYHLQSYKPKIREYIKKSHNQKISNDKKLNKEIKFKDVKKNAHGEVTGFKSTIDNFKAILNYMEYKYKYNVVSHDIDIFLQGQLLEDKSSAKGLIFSMAQKHDCTMKAPEISMFINSVAMENKYNPWQEYVMECVAKYEDAEGLKEYKTVKSLFESLILRNHYDKDFAFLLFEKFLMHFIASFELQDYGCNGVFVLQGAQNGGKTSFFRALVPDGFFKEGMSVNPESDDSVRKILKYMLVELGEIEGTLKADVNKLKNFITEKTFAFRKQYSDFIEENKRYTVLCGTCNSEEFLKDETGDRRYWVIPIASIDFNKLNNIDIDMLWAEVYYLFKERESQIPLIRGKRKNHAHELDRNESSKLININKEDFTFKTTQQIQIEDVFDWSTDERYYISTKMISLHLFDGAMLPAKIAAVLNSLNLEKDKKRVYGTNTWYYLTPPLVNKDLMEKLGIVNVKAESKKKELISKLGKEVETWE